MGFGSDVRVTSSGVSYAFFRPFGKLERLELMGRDIMFTKSLLQTKRTFGFGECGVR